jgi:hypothetical protein
MSSKNTTILYIFTARRSFVNNDLALLANLTKSLRIILKQSEMADPLEFYSPIFLPAHLWMEI